MSGKGTSRELYNTRSCRDDPFERAFRDGAVPSAVISPHGEFLDVNAPLCELTDYARAELLARRVPDLIPPELEDRDTAAILRCIEEPGVGLDLSTRVVCASGDQVWVHVTASLIRDEGGEPEFFVAHILDMSAEKLMEEALAQSERRFRLAFEEAPIGVGLTDGSGAITEANAHSPRCWATRPRNSDRSAT